MNMLKILVKNPNPQKSVILIDNEQYIVNCPKQDTQGLEYLIENMFQILHKEKISEVVSKISLSNTRPKNICEIAEIKPFLFKKRDKWYEITSTQQEIYRRVAEVIGLILWLKNEDKHFKKYSDLAKIVAKTLKLSK